MGKKIRVAILEDHPSVVDGYRYRLEPATDIEIVEVLTYGKELAPFFAQAKPIDVLLLDVNVPTSATNRNPYPIHQMVPKLRSLYPGLQILVISMYKQRSVIKAVMQSGASGYILKDDRQSLAELGSVIRTVAGGGVYFSKEAHEQIADKEVDGTLLSPRQLEVISLYAAYPDSTSAEIGKMMGLADATVRNLLSAAYLKLGVRGRTAAIARAKELGILASVDVYPKPPPQS
ncbi:MAG: response regulator transcription factor [Caldilineaceae bacterium]